jgi:hypothetical protein
MSAIRGAGTANGIKFYREAGLYVTRHIHKLSIQTMIKTLTAKGPGDQGCSHNQLHPRLRSAPKVAPVPRKPFIGRKDILITHAKPTSDSQ